MKSLRSVPSRDRKGAVFCAHSRTPRESVGEILGIWRSVTVAALKLCPTRSESVTEPRASASERTHRTSAESYGVTFRCLTLLILNVLASAVLCAALSAQTKTPAPPSPEMSQKEQDSLREALGEAGNSQVDFERALENHLDKYPNSPKRAEMERALVKTAIELKDNPRIILYGEKVLEREADDMQILERVTVALLQTGGTENQERALKHAEHFAAVVKKTDESEKDLNSRDKVRHKDDHDRAAARALLLEARANGVLGHIDPAISLAEKSYETFPSVEGAREAARWLDKAGQTDKAIEYMADSFTISGLQSANPDAAEDRKSIGELYRKLNGSEKGLGDLILKSYDRTYAGSWHAAKNVNKPTRTRR